LLLRVARQAMVEHGLEPDFPPAALAEAGGLSDDASARDGAERDLRALPWCSIDNDDSRDLDQLTVADAPAGGCTTIRVAVADVPGLEENLKLQDGLAQQLKAHRHDHGALELETVEARAEFDGDTVGRLAAEKPNRARDLIEDFMIAANGIVARFLEAHRFP